MTTTNLPTNPSMTRRKHHDLIEKEARVQEAVAAIKEGKHTCYSAARVFNIPRQTLYNRVNGKLPRNQAHEAEQLLSHAEEKELIRWITLLTLTGYPPRYITLLQMAEEIRKRRIKNINDDDIQLI